jgi:hypothetical protein
MKLELGPLSSLRKVLSCEQLSTVFYRLFAPLQRGDLAQVGRRQVLFIRNAIKGGEPHQTRGIVMTDSPVRFVAGIPVDMGMVSSVMITTQLGTILHKGEEPGYFPFGDPLSSGSLSGTAISN